jgi:DNA-binding PadR family transcriptional regulator
MQIGSPLALKHAILAALSRGVPRTGYELNASFSEDHDRAWHASPSQVYAELTKMEGSDLIEISDRNQRGRTSYRITETGLAELRRWLVRDEPDHSIRDDSMLRLITLWVLDDGDARYLIEAEKAFQRKRQMDLSHMLETWDKDREDTRVWRNRRATYMLWLSQTNLMVEWLDGLLEILEDPSVSVVDALDGALTPAR